MDTNEFIGVPVHEDVSSYEEKIYAGFTKRQVICIGGGAALAVALGVGLIGFAGIPSSIASYIIMIICVPIMLLAMLKPDDLPLEEWLGLALSTLDNPQQLKYRSSASKATHVTSFAYRRLSPSDDELADAWLKAHPSQTSKKKKKKN